MSDTFDSSIEQGLEEGRRLAGLDAEVAGFQRDFLALCLAFRDKMTSLDEGLLAEFSVRTPGNPSAGQVRVMENDDVYFRRNGLDMSLGRDPRIVGRQFLGNYDRQGIDELRETIAEALRETERSMSDTLREMAIRKARWESKA